MDIGEETWTYEFEPMPEFPAPVEEPVAVPVPELEPQPA